MARANTFKDLQKEIKIAIDIARDLCYDESVIEKLKNAQSNSQIEQILYTARKES